ncbi:MAG: class I SAM-dependent DNA methyltransferase [Bacillota bacterium]
MLSYAGLSAVYDRLVSGVDFDGWIDYVESLAGRYGYSPGSVLDLACGTGNTLIPFARKGYRSVGVDLSPEMIAVAREKSSVKGLNIEYHVGDMRYFCPDSPVDLVTCFHDGLNYITDPEDIEKIFINASSYINSDGMLIFDLNAIKWIGSSDKQPVVIDEEDITIIYNTFIDNTETLWSVDVTCFVREGDLYRKFSETHRERGYTEEEIEKALNRAGFNLLSVYDGFTFDPPHPKSRRHFYVARKA